MPDWVKQWFRDFFQWLRGYIYSIFALFLDQVHADETWVLTGREAEVGGCVVHVLRSVHPFDSLCIHRLCVRNGLRDIGYVYGLEGWLLRPVRWIYRFMMRHKRDVEDRTHLEAVLDEGRSAILCLRRSPRTFHARGQEIGTEVIKWLRQYGARTGNEVILVPHSFVWGPQPQRDATSVLDRLFGTKESPGMIRALLQFARSRRTVTIRAYPAVRLSDQDGTDEEIRNSLATTLDRARRTVTGPLARSAFRTADRVMSNPVLVDDLSRISTQQGKSISHVSKEAEKELGRLMARPFPAAVGLMDAIFKRVFPTLYDGIEMEPDDLAQVRHAVERGPVIILPTHRSHIDYLLLSWIFYHRAIPLPFVAAGRNLSFWPLSTIFGGCNAFFIPRTLVGKDIERAVLRAYAHYLLSEGHNIEIFLEGTRSRSGKMLPLRTGLLEMFLEKARDLDGKTVSLLPVSLCYERVIEEGYYAGEQAGGSKDPEGLGGLLRTSDFLAADYGKLVVCFGSPVELRDLEKDDPDPGSDRSVKRIAYRVAWEMNSLEALTPTGLVATVLLQCPPLGIDETTLFDCALFYIDVLAASGKPMASTLRPCLGLEPARIGCEDEPRFVQLREALYQAIHLLGEDDLVRIAGQAGSAVYSVPWETRLRLDYYRNSAIGMLAAPAIVCRVLKTMGWEETVDITDVRSTTKFLSGLLRHEFVFDAHHGFEENFNRTLALLELKKIIRIDADRINCTDTIGADRLAACVEPVLETYRLTALALSDVSRRLPVPEWEALLRTFNLHDRLYLEGDAIYVESRNRSAIKLALRSFTDMGELGVPKPKHYELPDDGEKRLADLARRIEGERPGA